MKPILVPVNFSHCAENAGRYAADLAQAVQAELHLVHVIQVPTTTADMVMTDYIYSEMVDAANTSLQTVQAELHRRTSGRITIHTHLESGNLSSKVKDLCQELGAYAVVLGASGPTLEKFLSGSPVASLLQLPYPVLVVPDTVAFRRFNRVALACDLHDLKTGIPHSLPLLRDLRGYFGTRFDVITVETSAVQNSPHPLCVSEHWRASLRDLYPELHFVTRKRVEEGLIDYLQGQPADLVVVFPKKHDFFEFHASQSRKFAKHSPIPVMSVHEA